MRGKVKSWLSVCVGAHVFMFLKHKAFESIIKRASLYVNDYHRTSHSVMKFTHYHINRDVFSLMSLERISIKAFRLVGNQWLHNVEIEAARFRKVSRQTENLFVCLIHFSSRFSLRDC